MKASRLMSRGNCLETGKDAGRPNGGLQECWWHSLRRRSTRHPHLPPTRRAGARIADPEPLLQAMDKSWVTTYNLSLIDQETRPTGASDLKTVLCYGDSNTWGYNPQTKERFPRNVRWPGVLRQELGEDYEIIEEGLNGRTTVWDDPNSGVPQRQEVPGSLSSFPPAD